MKIEIDPVRPNLDLEDEAGSPLWDTNLIVSKQRKITSYARARIVNKASCELWGDGENSTMKSTMM